MYTLYIYMSLADEIHNICLLFGLNPNFAGILYWVYINDINKFKTDLDAKKKGLLEGPAMNMLSQGGGGGDTILALLIVIFGIITLSKLNSVQEEIKEQGESNQFMTKHVNRRLMDESRKQNSKLDDLMKWMFSQDNPESDTPDTPDIVKRANEFNARLLGERADQMARKKKKRAKTPGRGSTMGRRTTHREAAEVRLNKSGGRKKKRTRKKRKKKRTRKKKTNN